MTIYKLNVLTYLVRTAMVDLVYGYILRLPTAQIAKFNVIMSNLLYVGSKKKANHVSEYSLALT